MRRRRRWCRDERYQVRIQLNDAGVGVSGRPPDQGGAVHHLLADDLAAPEAATVTVFGGTLDLPVRPPQAADAALPALPDPETATPERPTVVRPGVVRIDRLGLELGTEGKFAFDIKDDDPLSATAEMQRTETIRRDAWQVRIETRMRLSCTRDAFLLQASLRAWEGADEVCHREWDRSIPRDLV